MTRCYGCCQENCGYTHCSCSCHGSTPRAPTQVELLQAVLEAARGVKYKTKALKAAIAEHDRRMQK